LTGWLYQNKLLEFIPETAKSFVYSITNLISNKKYIGFKLFYFAKYQTTKGKRKRIFVESDWRDYWSSCESLKADVLTLGTENFSREILYLAPNKAIGKYLEARLQMDLRVLENPLMYYNGIVNCRISKQHIAKLGVIMT
jgi:hypothetical protein